jgi:hypothetical protein
VPRSGRSPLALLPWFASALFGCAPEPASHGPDVNGGGPLFHARTTLRTLEHDQHAALITGLSGIDILHASGWEAVSVRHPQPECVGYPVAMTAGEISGDGALDVLVMDAGCGNWVISAAATAGEPLPWEALLPPAPTTRTVHVEDFDADGADEIVLADAASLTVLERSTGVWQMHSRALPGPGADFMRTMRFTIPFRDTRDDRPGALIQRGVGAFEFLPLSPGSPDYILEPEPMSQGLTEYVKPFEAYDHLTALRFAGCSVFALGIGLFDAAAGEVPRRIQLLERSSDGFLATTLPTLVNPTTFAVAQHPTEPRALLAAIEARPGGDRLEVGELSECRGYETWSVYDIDLDFRTVDSPAGFDEPRLSETAGIELAASREGDELRLLHYDGFSARQFVRRASGSLESTIVPIHGSRDDTAY